MDVTRFWRECLNYFSEHIGMFLKLHKINSLGVAANAAKNTKAGHRVYLRCMTLLENELEIKNEENAEKEEGFINNKLEEWKKQKEKEEGGRKFDPEDIEFDVGDREDE